MYHDNAHARHRAGPTFSHPTASQDASRDRVDWLLEFRDTPSKDLAQRILVTGSPLYRRAFNKKLSGQTLSPEEQRAAAPRRGGGFHGVATVSHSRWTPPSSPRVRTPSTPTARRAVSRPSWAPTPGRA